jgi:hypothetical protein
MLTSGDKKILKVRGAAIAVLLIFILLLMWFASYPYLVERYYSEGFYRLMCHILHSIFNLFPFSIGDLLYIAVVGYLVYAFIWLIRLTFKKQWVNAGLLVLKLTIGWLCAILIFYLFWGMNYFRRPAGELLHLKDSTYTTADLQTVGSILIDSANATRARLTTADLRQSNSAIYQTSVKAINKLSHDSVNFYTYSPSIKPSLLTPLLNYMATSGYYNPFTGETQMNYQMPVFNRPVTACHEMGHQMGYGTEDEANFVGFIAGIGSADRLLRYSAYHLAVDEFMHALYFRDSLANKALKPRISKAVHHDFVIERKYWLSYRGQIDNISAIFYDKFLKINNQPQGIKTYNRMVQLVMAMYLGRRKSINHGQ